MSTTTTSLRTIDEPDATSSPGSDSAISTEPAIPHRERAVLREVLRLVAERADAEAKVEGDRASSAAAADSEYEKTRRALIEKLRNLETEAIAADEKRRRGIVDLALDGERKAKSEFAANSRKLATLFDSARDVAKNEYNNDKNEAAGNFDSAQKKTAKEHAEKTKPIQDSAAMANAYRERLAVLAADYPPEPTRESYERLNDPGDELFTRLARMEPPLRLLEGLIIPKSMKGARETWVFLFVILPLVGIASALGLTDGTQLGAVVVVGAALAVALRMWLIKLSQSQLQSRYMPLMHALADADALTAHCRVLVDAAFKEERKRVAARRDDELKRAEEKYRKAFAAAEAQRDEKLRKINEVYAARMVEIQTSQQRDLREAIADHDRRLAELRVQVETSLPRLEAKYKSLKARLAAEYETAWRDHGGGGGARPHQPRGRQLWPSVERCVVGRARVAAGCSAGRSLWNDPPRSGRAAAGDRGRRALDGGDTGVVHLPRAADFSRCHQSHDRDAGRRARRGTGRASGIHDAVVDQPAAGPGAVHDRRSHRDRPQFWRVHAPGRL